MTSERMARRGMLSAGQRLVDALENGDKKVSRSGAGRLASQRKPSQRKYGSIVNPLLQDYMTAVSRYRELVESSLLHPLPPESGTRTDRIRNASRKRRMLSKELRIPKVNSTLEQQQLRVN